MRDLPVLTPAYRTARSPDLVEAAGQAARGLASHQFRRVHHRDAALRCQCVQRLAQRSGRNGELLLCWRGLSLCRCRQGCTRNTSQRNGQRQCNRIESKIDADVGIADSNTATRSEEHTSELQSLMRISYAVFCLKKKKTQHN